MRTNLSILFVLSVAACGGVAPDDSVGRSSEAVTVNPSTTVTVTCLDAVRLVAGRALTVESTGTDHLVVRAGGEPLCEGTLSSVVASGILGNRPPPSGSTQPAGSDPMPARGDSEDDKGGTGGTSGSGGNGGTGGVGGSGPAGGGETGTSPGGEGKSDPMPADDTRRN